MRHFKDLFTEEMKRKSLQQKLHYNVESWVDA